MTSSNSKLKLTIGLFLPLMMSFGSHSVPAHRMPKSNAKTLYLQNGTTLRKCDDVRDLAKKLPGSKVSEKNSVCIWDLGGGILNGSKQKGNGGQGENQEPLFRASTSLIVQNGFVLNNKNGAGFSKPNSGVRNMTWLNVGEDAVYTSRGAKNFLIENCEFINKRGGDKSIQANEAEGLKMFNNLVFSGITCARVGSKAAGNSPSDIAEAGGNRFVGCDTAYNISSITLKIVKKDSYEKVRKKEVLDSGAKIRR
jgi:hypothetical protein